MYQKQGSGPKLVHYFLVHNLTPCSIRQHILGSPTDVEPTIARCEPNYEQLFVAYPEMSEKADIADAPILSDMISYTKSVISPESAIDV